MIPAVVALALWAPQLRAHSAPATVESRASMWNQPLAWQVSLFMACQSTAFYVMIAWFPSMMSDLDGISAARSGVILFIYQIFVLGSVMVTPVFIHRMRDQRAIGVALSGMILLGYLGLYFDPAHALAWMIVMGMGSGGALVLAITLFSLRVETATQSVSLSGHGAGGRLYGGRRDPDLHRLHPRRYKALDSSAVADDPDVGVATGNGLSVWTAADDPHSLKRSALEFRR